MRLRIEKYSFRFADEVLNSRLSLKQEIEAVLFDARIDVPSLSRKHFNSLLKHLFVEKGWESQPSVFDEPGQSLSRQSRGGFGRWHPAGICVKRHETWPQKSRI